MKLPDTVHRNNENGAISMAPEMHDDAGSGQWQSVEREGAMNDMRITKSQEESGKTLIRDNTCDTLRATQITVSRDSENGCNS